MKRVLRFLYSTKFVLILVLLINVAVFAAVVLALGYVSYYIFSILSVISLIIIIYFSKDSAQYKLIWVVLIFVVPLFGCALYVYVKGDKGTKNKRALWKKINDRGEKELEPCNKALTDLKEKDFSQYKASAYVAAASRMPLCQNSETKYLKDGEIYFEEVFKELEKAEKFILMEYFIISEGRIFNRLLKILKKKLSEGVEIKLLYDDFGCVDKFKDKKTLKKLNSLGDNIETIPFNKITAFLSAFVNYRTHRKIVIVDGRVAFTGGVNIGDEYANLTVRYGYWKDAGVKITGDAVWSLTVMFLNDWQFSARREVDILRYKSINEQLYIENKQIESTSTDKEIALTADKKEYVQPFDAGPFDHDSVAKNMIINLMNNAHDYFYVSTPYFVVDNEFMLAMKLAARSGVDVRLVFPGIPDKKFVYYLGRSCFAELIEAGVKIYSYKKGFNHAKILVTDDKTAMVSTINLDFRSLYFHFEDGVLIHNSHTVDDVKDDFAELFADCDMVTLEDMKKRPWYEKLIALTLRFVSVLI